MKPREMVGFLGWLDRWLVALTTIVVGRVVGKIALHAGLPACLPVGTSVGLL